MSPRMGPIISLVGFDVVQRNWGWFLRLELCRLFWERLRWASRF